jgi:MFS family permease
LFLHKYTSSMQKNTVEATAAVTPARAVGVLLLCFLFNFLARGMADTFMVFLLPLQAQFGWHRAQMTGVYSALMLVAGMVSPLAGVVFDRYGPRILYAGGVAMLAIGYLVASRAQVLWHFYLGIGLFVGLGSGAVGMVPAAALLSWWYRGRLASAIGVAYAGFGCGSLVMVPLAQTLIQHMGWRPAYSWLGTGLLAIGVLALVLPWRAITAARPAPSGERPVAGQRGPLRQAIGQRRFWLLVQIMFFTAFGMYLVLVQSVAYLVDVGFTPLQSATAFGAAGMLSVVGVSSSGWMTDRFGPRNAATASFVGTTLGIAMLYALTYRRSEALLVAYIVLFGICQGARGPVVASLSARMFAGQGQSTIYGAIYACMSVGTGLGALLSGALHDWTGGYRAGFLIALVSVWLAAAPFWTSQDKLAPAAPAAKPDGALT